MLESAEAFVCSGECWARWVVVSEVDGVADDDRSCFLGEHLVALVVFRGWTNIEILLAVVVP